MSDQANTPEEGELVVVTVKNVKQNGVYVDFDEYPGLEGFIFIGEIASGWVKNIRTFVRDGQRLICKVMRTKKRWFFPRTITKICIRGASKGQATGMEKRTKVISTSESIR